MTKYLPFLDWIKGYKKSDFGGDLTAGLTVGVMLIPQGMAYAMLAGLPPIYGLYASTIPLFIYALLGTSRQLAVGPTALVALLVAAGVGPLAEAGSVEYIALAILLALMVGVIQLLMGIFRVGFIVNFLSHPVISGFTSAAAFIIAASQLKHLLGISIPRGKFHETLIHVAHHFSDINWPTFVLGAVAITILFFIKKIKRRIPGPLIIVFLGILAVQLFQLTTSGVKVIGEVPGGLPTFGIPEISWGNIQALVPAALTISIIGFIESIAIAKVMQKKHKYYELDNNQELRALGLSNIVGVLFQSFPVTGGLSRTAVNDQSGSRSGLASIISGSVIILTLLFFTAYFHNLPKAVLSAIIMVAIFGLVDIKEAKHLWKTDKRDFTLFMITAISTIALGIEEGILIGAVLSLGWVVYKTAYPNITELKPEESEHGLIFKESGENTSGTIEKVLVYRVDARLYFANCTYFKETILNHIKGNDTVEHVILDASGVNDIDSSAAQVIEDLQREFKTGGVRLHIAGLKDEIKAAFSRHHLLEKIGHEFIHHDISSAWKSLAKKKTSSTKSDSLITS